MRAAGGDRPGDRLGRDRQPHDLRARRSGRGRVFTTAGHATEGNPLATFNALYEATRCAFRDRVQRGRHDLVKVLEAAVTAAGSTEPQALRDAIANLENVQGATSLITYKGTDGMPVREVTLIRVTGGARELVGQPAPDAALIPAPRMQ
ncbi:MAG: hypothetical protein R3D80_20490 [Paracoccaceae bacterium]